MSLRPYGDLQNQIAATPHNHDNAVFREGGFTHWMPLHKPPSPTTPNK